MAKTKYNTIKRTTTFYHDKVEKLFKKLEEKLKRPLRFTTKRSVEAIIFLIVFFAFFGLLAYKMSLPKMLNTLSKLVIASLQSAPWAQERTGHSPPSAPSSDSARLVSFL